MTAHPPYRTGFVTLVGRPNVGKSTLMNAFMGQKIAAVSPRPQTTRHRQLGILTTPQAQIIFMDTPGMHKAHHKLGEYMNEVASATLPDADVVVWLVDISQPPNEEDQALAGRIRELEPAPPVILAMNKVDLVPVDELGANQLAFEALVPRASPIQLSAQTGYQCDRLLGEIIQRLPEGPALFDEEQITDLYEREIAVDLIREAALVHLRDEVPYALAVRLDEYTERGETGAYIVATLFVERETQKPIVIGQGGEMLKKIGSSARKEIEAMSGRKVFLDLRVKVEKNWRNSPDALRQFGYTRPEE
ncbi:MAG TPA: GTPase Era [Anaerolineaceae bacterium]|nr:GTPase Era [Anaerolineaceae bacterium]